MSKQQNFVCDGCNEIIYGRDRNAFVSGHQYFTMKSSFAMQMVDEETGASYHFFIGRPDSEFAFHIDKNCLDDFLQREIQLHHNRRKAQLMEEVSRAGGSAYVMKPEPKYIARGNYQAPAAAPKQHFGYNER